MSNKGLIFINLLLIHSKGKILSNEIFSLAFGGSLVLANLSHGSDTILCLWHLVMIFFPLRYMFLLKYIGIHIFVY